MPERKSQTPGTSSAALQPGLQPGLQPNTLAAQLRATARACAEQEAFVAPGERLRWRDLEAATWRTARALMAAGVQRGDHVGILMGNSGSWLEIFFACATLGATTVPVNTRFKVEEERGSGFQRPEL